MASVELKLAACTAFRSTGLMDSNLTREDARHIFLMQMEDFFRFEPKQASLFDEKAVLEEAKAIPDDESGYQEILNILGEIGFRAMPKPPDQPATWDVENELWQEATNRFLVERDKNRELSH